ncbi:response regulator transcription factor [Caulobacter soli]|uniref:response regulator transcription factor n=1 Tax=Caulobacter soli TaxID=2708539 RepID=UPI0013EB585C|nr:LuxR C-terminal-related transcriptional regulator [Caulobacter soli]
MFIAVSDFDRSPEGPPGTPARGVAVERRASLGLDQRLRALAQDYGFYSGLYLHIGHAVCGPEQTAPSRLVASSPIALRQYGTALAASSVARRAAAAYRPFAWTSIEERLPGFSGRCAGLAIPVQDHAAGPGLVALIGQDLDMARALAGDSAGVLALAAADLHQSALSDVRPAATASSALTGREIECLRLAALGRTVAETGKALGISSRTVEFHLKNVTEKLGATNKIHAVALSVSLGLVSLKGGG